MCFIQDSISTILIDNFNYFYTVSIPWMNRHANVFYQHLVFIAKIVPFLSEYLLIRKNLGRNTGPALKITRKSLCDGRKALSNGHHDHHYLDIATTFINFSFFANSSKTIFAII